MALFTMAAGMQASKLQKSRVENLNFRLPNGQSRKRASCAYLRTKRSFCEFARAANIAAARLSDATSDKAAVARTKNGEARVHCCVL